jgi:hypothetical protein
MAGGDCIHASNTEQSLEFHLSPVGNIAIDG